MAGKSKQSQAWRGGFSVTGKGTFRLARHDPSATPGVKSRKAAEHDLERITRKLVALQGVLYAEGRHAVLIVLQAMDTGGKDGTIRHVFGPLNPQGVAVTGFKVPTPDELAHDYLWRVHRDVPPKGTIRIFNRSHYEDVLVARVHGLAPMREIDRRYEQINAFERYLTQNGVTILKFFLNIGKAEQKRRLEARLTRSDKQWKFNPGDLAERRRWGAYMRAYEKAISACGTPWAPWHVIPADCKWYRNYAVARIVLETLQGMKLRYPAPKPGMEKVKVE
jgi:PPK2 family polyphosphate:nucleotide phosphotransferase